MSDESTAARMKAARWLAASGKMPLEELEKHEAEAGLAEAHWPAPLASEALYGIAGDVVSTIFPHSEADKVAILAQFLVAAGNCLGRGPHTMVESDRHGTNLFAVLVGSSSKGRKGTSFGHVKRLLNFSDPEWTSRIVSGLSSGEGLIHAVRDPSKELGKNGLPIDDGVADKRLFVKEPEFAKVLRVSEREGSTLSPTIRDAWDDGDLQTLKAANPRRATGAHISIIGHVTSQELLRYLTQTESANGFANRFMFFSVKRSKHLPEGGHLSDEALTTIAQRIRGAIKEGTRYRLLTRDDGARAIWASVYPRLSRAVSGLFGSVTGRAEAQVLRLSLLYAVLDGASSIGEPHLLAALALWRYAEDSARHIFGNSLGDPYADRILDALRSAPDGMTRTQISVDVFNRNTRIDRIDAALQGLAADGSIRTVREEATGGRPAERFFARATKDDERTKKGASN